VAIRSPSLAGVRWPDVWLICRRMRLAIGLLRWKPWWRWGVCPTAALWLHLAGRLVTELSGGERARVMLARALAGTPSILLADEPVSGLDPYHWLETMESLRHLVTRGASVVMVLHDLTLAGRFADRLVLLDQGRVVADGPPEAVLTSELLASVYRIAAITGSYQGEDYMLPWQRLGRRGSGHDSGGEGPL
jgi:hypothetical protein